MKNKYYTPSLEEIYSSPELILVDNDFITIHPFVYRKGDVIIDLEKEVDLSNARVKYLDEEDINSLGFTTVKRYSDDMMFQLHTSDYEFYELTWQFEDDNRIIIEYWAQEKMVVKPLHKETWGHVDIFIGYIKNKQELKKLLTQLNVLRTQ